MRLRGYTVVGLNLDDLVATRLPALVEEHFPDSADYRIAIVSRDGERVVFESEPGAAAATTDAPDLTRDVLPAARRPDDGLRPGRGQRARRRDAGRGHAAAARRRHRALPSAPPRRSSTCSRLRDRDGDRTLRTRTVQHPHGHWSLRVKHRAGSLEAAVAASRRRNLALSGGVLALLGVAVALIAVSARRAQALARQQMEFVAAVSHELRTPVAVIHSAAGNLADGVVGDPPQVKRYGATIQTEARRLGETVERVLQLAGLGSGRPLPMAPLSAAEVVHDAVQHTALDAERAGVTVELEIASELPSLVGDGPSLQSAVRNLVGNAVKYAGTDRWVRVRVSPGGTPSKREVHIAVDDHGPGLDADEQRQVFEPFFRGRDAVANQIQGSGLGPEPGAPDRRRPRRPGRAGERARPRQHLHHLPARRQHPAAHRRRAVATRRAGRDRRRGRRRPERGRRTPAARRRRARPAAHAERSPRRRGLLGGNGRRRRPGPGPRHLRGVRPHRARRDAAQARRLRRLPHAAAARRHHAGPDAHRPRPGSGSHRRAQARCRRLPDQAVRAARAAGAHRGAAAPGPGVHRWRCRPAPARAGRRATRSTSSSSTCARPR